VASRYRQRKTLWGAFAWCSEAGNGSLPARPHIQRLPVGIPTGLELNSLMNVPIQSKDRVQLRAATSRCSTIKVRFSATACFGLESTPSHIVAASTRISRGLLWLSCVCWLTGCSLFPDIRHKPQFINPYPQIRKVAILPFSNQSEEPTLSGKRVALAYADEMQSIRGFEVLPQGAVINKMREFGRPLSTGEDFQTFAQYLGVDVVLVGSITDYDPYYPPRMTMKVNWYAANPGFHPVEPGYGLPWGTSEEKNIPRWIHYEAQRALAAEQMESQTPVEPMLQPIMPEDRQGHSGARQPPPTTKLPSGPDQSAVSNMPSQTWGSQELATSTEFDGRLPDDWPDPRGFIPDPPSSQPPEYRPQHAPIISHMRSFNGHDEDFTEQLADYFYFRDDARFGGWQAYLQRSEDFIRFCCYLHLTETLASRGGQEKSRMILRWPIDRYTR
jgi:hypothetical protein